MIIFKNNSNQLPLKKFREKYYKAKDNENYPFAASISSYNPYSKEISSRFVNIKYLDDDKFIFFTNYNSPKAYDFEMHNQIAVNFYWNSINTQVRIQANIKKTPKSFNKKYFKNRNIEKNALAISSNQSNIINSFSEIKENYLKVKENADLLDCPDFWGGYYFKPYKIEFWEGDKFRLNKRLLFLKQENEWISHILEP